MQTTQNASSAVQDTDSPIVRGNVYIRDGKCVIEFPLPLSDTELRANAKGRPYITVKPEAKGPLTFAVEGHAVEITAGLVLNVPLKVRVPGTKPGQKPARRFTFGA